MKVELQVPETGARRGCGERKRGAYYIEVPLSPGGLPVWRFILDPLIPYTGGPFRGVRLVEAGGRQLILDWVGEKYYPYPIDFLDEAGKLGVSRRVQKTFPFSRLKPGALLVLAHRRVLPASLPAGAPARCPNGIRLMEHTEWGCGGWLFHAPPTEADTPRRVIPGTVIDGEVEPPPVEEWQPGLFAAFPLRRVAYVRAGDERDEEAVEVLRTLREVGLEALEVDH